MDSLTRRRKAGFFALMLIGLLMVSELISASVFLIVEGRLFSLAEQIDRRRQIHGGEQQGAEASRAEGFEALVGPPNSDIFSSREVLHPYLGFVFNPELNNFEDRQGPHHLRVSADGFFQTSSDVENSPAEVEVAVFGGSVAMMFCFQGREALLRGLDRLPLFRGKTLNVSCYALGGFKQPQQLMTLGYLLSQSRKIDAVINLDGFNEVALSYQENYLRQVAPHYPRGWKERVDDFSNRQVQWLLGRTVFLRRQRAGLARVFSRDPWQRSISVNLIWRLLDRWIARDLISAQREAANFVPLEHSYEWQGPYVEMAGRQEVFEQMAELWSQSSTQMHHLCAANGIPYFHFLQPNQYLPGSKPMSREERLIALDERSPYAWIVSEAYPLLQESGRELREAGVAFHDLSGIFQDTQDLLYVDNCCHLNQEGSGRLAEAIIRTLESSWHPETQASKGLDAQRLTVDPRQTG